MEPKKKFAFILMGTHYQPEEHHAEFRTSRQTTLIVSVNNFEEAQKKVLELAGEGVGAIELCGAFGEERARQLDDLTGHRIAIGYVTHTGDQDERFAAFFKK